MLYTTSKTGWAKTLCPGTFIHFPTQYFPEIVEVKQNVYRVRVLPHSAFSGIHEPIVSTRGVICFIHGGVVGAVGLEVILATENYIKARPVYDSAESYNTYWDAVTPHYHDFDKYTDVPFHFLRTYYTPHENGIDLLWTQLPSAPVPSSRA